MPPSGTKRRAASGGSIHHHPGRDNRTFEKIMKANGEYDGPRKRHKRSQSTHMSWLEGFPKDRAGLKDEMVRGREVMRYSYSNYRKSRTLYTGAMAPAGTMPIAHNPYYTPMYTHYYPSYSAYYNQVSLSQASIYKSLPPVLVRKFTTAKFSTGPYEWTLPQYLCSAGLDYSPGILIRRFMFWQDNDRTQFEGHKRRALGELAHWKGHGPSRLRNTIYASSDEKASKEAKKKGENETHHSRMTLNARAPLPHSQTAASAQATYTCTSSGVYETDDSSAFCASTMDLEQLESLF